MTHEMVITFLVTQGSSSTKNELADFFGLDTSMPAESALVKQRAKLKPKALGAVFKGFNSLAASGRACDEAELISADDPSFTFLASLNFLRTAFL